MTRVLTESCDNMNVTADGIYFGIKGKIYKIDIDGGQSVAINEDLNVSSFNVTEDAIYYLNDSGLGKITLNGSGATVLNADWGEDINVAGGWIYSQKGIFCYKVKTDGSEYVKIGK